MKPTPNALFDFYKKCISQTLAMVFLLIVLCTGAGYFTQQFTFDASADTLVAEGDEDLLYFRQMVEYFGEEDFLYFTFRPIHVSLLSPEGVAQLDLAVRRLEKVSGVEDVMSILDAPLLKSPPMPLSELASGYRTIKSPDVNLKLALIELTNSPLFKGLLISDDGKTAMVRLKLEEDKVLLSLIRQRDLLRASSHPSKDEREQLKRVEESYLEAKDDFARKRGESLAEIRKIKKSLENDAIVNLGGVSLVASDMIEYVKRDITIFGYSVLVLIMTVLYAFFRQARWVFIPVATTTITLLLTTGVLGLLHQPATVISSNFISLLAITTISIVVHLINKYNELVRTMKGEEHLEIVFQTMKQKFAPCFYTAITTMVAFASLMTSDIVPVTDFGWIMCLGVVMAFISSYLFFPVAVLMIPCSEVGVSGEKTPEFVNKLGKISVDKVSLVLKSSFGIGLISIIGMLFVSLDNRFIDYFKNGTEIKDGLVYIDENFGGTVSLDMTIKFPPYINPSQDFNDDFFSDEVDNYPERYWFTPDKIQVLNKIHDYLEARPEIGKVVSLATLEGVAREFNDGKPLGAVELVTTLSVLPENLRKELINPYAMPSKGLMRVTTRVHETGPAFSRDNLIEDIKNFTTNELNIEEDRVHLTGMTVLFNGMLKNLFSSQTSTIGFVVIALFGMFFLLLGSATLAWIALVPNVLAAMLILAFMGYAGIPLDMMTITIAAIIIGIGVDDAIHYLYRFKKEYTENKNVELSIKNSHASIGSAMYFTSITVIIGFSVLTFSNFIPTVYFGILTSLAMVLALFANLIILPSLLVKFYNSKK